MTDHSIPTLKDLLARRFADAPANVPADLDTDMLTQMAGHGSCRSFQPRPVDAATLDVLCAVALAAPSKSDLQQRDIVVLHDPMQRRALAALTPEQPWVAAAPALAVFCGNNSRQRQLHEWRDIPFANDHLDAFFNAIVDAAIALSAFVTAAEAAGLGCCPISAVRNHAQAVSDLLELPPYVFPVAGLAIGHPEAAPRLSKRLPLAATCHRNRYNAQELQAQVAEYDAARAEDGSYPSQRETAMFGASANYGWSEDKVRQYSKPERADFGRFVRAKGFNLD